MDDEELQRRFREAHSLVSRHGTGDVAQEAHAMMVELANAGCASAFPWAGNAYLLGYGVKQSYRNAAKWQLKAVKARCGFEEGILLALLRKHPWECTPFGEWGPELTPLVAREVFLAMRMTMLLCKRRGVPRDVAISIVEYVCTEGEEWTRKQSNDESSSMCTVQ